MTAAVAAPGLMVAARYRLDRALGGHSPSVAAVVDTVSLWRAFDTVLARHVAVVLLARTDRRAPTVLEAARRAAGVNHPRLAQVYDAGEDGDYAYVVTELLDGGSLEDQLLAGPLETDRAIMIVVDIGDAVGAAHSAGLPHLALSPRRVLFTTAGVPKLVGLGVAAALAGLGPVTGASGSTRSAGPDERGHPDSSDAVARADTQGLGLLLYAALTARWAGPHAESTLPAAPWSEGRLCTPGQVRAGIPRGLDAIVTSSGPEHIRTWPAVTTEPLRTPQAFVQALTDLDHHGRGGKAAPVTSPAASDDLGAPTGTLKRVLRVVVPLAVLTVVVAGVWLSSQQIRSTSLPDHQPTRSTSTRPTPGSDAATIPIVAARDFDPDGDGTENPQQVPLAYDGNPQTAWTTQTYRTAALGNLKPGVGLVVDLGQPVTVGSVTVQLVGIGTDIELRAGSTDPTTERSMTVVANADDATGTVVLTPRTPTKQRYWLLWLTKLPQTGSNDYRGGIAEMVFHP